MAVDAMAQKLKVLQSEGGLASSRLTAKDRIRLRSLYEAGVLEEIRSGAGKTVVVKNREGFEAFLRNIYPSGLEGHATPSTPRKKAVAELRDSKRAGTSGQPIVLLRGFDGCALRCGLRVLPVAELTELAGVVAFHAGARAWEYSGTLAVVENLEAFWNFEKIGTGAPMAIYAGGRLSGKILDWLGSQSMARARIIHCGDYDPVGLDEYLRLKSGCPGRAEIFLPANLENLLARYGKKELLQGSNSALLARLRKTEDREVRKLVSMLDRYGVGLEQEILL
jgi:hypothetical protein